MVIDAQESSLLPEFSHIAAREIPAVENAARQYRRQYLV
jgi:hypothetical protein